MELPSVFAPKTYASLLRRAGASRKVDCVQLSVFWGSYQHPMAACSEQQAKTRNKKGETRPVVIPRVILQASISRRRLSTFPSILAIALSPQPVGLWLRWRGITSRVRSLARTSLTAIKMSRHFCCLMATPKNPASSWAVLKKNAAVSSGWSPNFAKSWNMFKEMLGNQPISPVLDPNLLSREIQKIQDPVNGMGMVWVLGGSSQWISNQSPWRVSLGTKIVLRPKPLNGL